MLAPTVCLRDWLEPVSMNNREANFLGVQLFDIHSLDCKSVCVRERLKRRACYDIISGFLFVARACANRRLWRFAHVLRHLPPLPHLLDGSIRDTAFAAFFARMDDAEGSGYRICQINSAAVRDVNAQCDSS